LIFHFEEIEFAAQHHRFPEDIHWRAFDDLPDLRRGGGPDTPSAM